MLLNISAEQVKHTLALLNDGATIPFVSRYRKEVTGGLNEVEIEEIKNRYDKLSELSKRKSTILHTISGQKKLSDELKKRIENCWDGTELEDIYLPYKPKRKTRAQAARQKGLEPLARLIMLQQETHLNQAVTSFVKEDAPDEEEALKGARDILAEQINEHEQARNQIRNLFARQAIIWSKAIKGKEEEGHKYQDYFNFAEPLKKCTSHRLLAIRRGEKEGILKVNISPEDTECMEKLEKIFLREITNAAVR